MTIIHTPDLVLTQPVLKRSQTSDSYVKGTSSWWYITTDGGKEVGLLLRYTDIDKKSYWFKLEDVQVRLHTMSTTITYAGQSVEAVALNNYATRGTELSRSGGVKWYLFTKDIESVFIPLKTNADNKANNNPADLLTKVGDQVPRDGRMLTKRNDNHIYKVYLYHVDVVNHLAYWAIKPDNLSGNLNVDPNRMHHSTYTTYKGGIKFSTPYGIYNSKGDNQFIYAKYRH